AECLSRLGRAGEAAVALRRAAEIDPSEPRAVRLLEASLEAQGDIEALIALDRQALIADPAGAVLERVRLARRLLALGRHDEAIAELAAGREVAPDSPALTEVLADALAAAGRGAERVALLTEL